MHACRMRNPWPPAAGGLVVAEEGSAHRTIMDCPFSHLAQRTAVEEPSSGLYKNHEAVKISPWNDLKSANGRSREMKDSS